MKKNIDSLVKIWDFNGFRKLKPKKEKIVKTKKIRFNKNTTKNKIKVCEFCGSSEEIEIIESQYICKNCFVKYGTSQPCEIVQISYEGNSRMPLLC
jgi:hypothetical protein